MPTSRRVLTRIRIPLEKSKGVYEKLRVSNSIDYPLAAVAVAMKKTSPGSVSAVLVPRPWSMTSRQPMRTPP